MNISEIGLIVKDAPMVGKQLKKMNIFERDNDPITNTSLSFMQENNNGVFILLTSIGRKWLFSEKESKIFPMQITLDNDYVIGVNEEHEFYSRNIDVLV